MLNHYIDCLSKDQALFQRQIRFYIANVSHVKTLEVELPASGSLVPLFNAFGLISAEELNTYQPYKGQACCTANIHALSIFARVCIKTYESASFHRPHVSCKVSLADSNECHVDFLQASLVSSANCCAGTCCKVAKLPLVLCSMQSMPQAFLLPHCLFFCLGFSPLALD